jgi:outer membrane protein
MKNKKLLACAAMAGLCMTAAHADGAGDFVTSIGWLHLAPQDSSSPMSVTALGATAAQSGTGAAIDETDTFGISGTYFVTDHIAAEGVFGVPPKMHLQGTGSLGALGELGTVREWSPTLLLKYYFGEPSSRFRAFVAAGGSYVWYRSAKLGQATTSGAFLYSSQYGSALTGPTSASFDSSFAPVANAGITYQFDKHWSAGVSLSYMWLSTHATLSTQSAVGTVTTRAKIKIDPVISFVSIGYRF